MARRMNEKNQKTEGKERKKRVSGVSIVKVRGSLPAVLPLNRSARRPPFRRQAGENRDERTEKETETTEERSKERQKKSTRRTCQGSLSCSLVLARSLSLSLYLSISFFHRRMCLSSGGVADVLQGPEVVRGRSLPDRDGAGAGGLGRLRNHRHTAGEGQSEVVQISKFRV